MKYTIIPGIFSQPIVILREDLEKWDKMTLFQRIEEVVKANSEANNYKESKEYIEKLCNDLSKPSKVEKITDLKAFLNLYQSKEV